MTRLLFDLETDNLLDKVTKTHCCVMQDLDTDEIRRYTSDETDGHGSIKEAVTAIQDADQLVGHNIIGYDMPVLRKLYGIHVPIDKVLDTLVLSRLLHTELKRFDYGTRTDEGFPAKLAGSHSLEAWGHRLGTYKGEQPESWEKYTPKMLEYCEEDILVNRKLLDKLLEKGWSQESIRLEHEVAEIIHLQEEAGVYFDTKKAGVLYGEWLGIQKKYSDLLCNEFKGWWKFEKTYTPKVNRKDLGYTKGSVMSKIEWVPFNPGSRDHIIKVLKEHYGWKPSKKTKKGNPALDDEVLNGLSKIPAAKTMVEYLTITKRISQLATGAQAWMNCVGSDNIIHGRVNSNGAITGRMTHYSPNVSQVPAVYSLYGKECRSLFSVRNPSNFLVGADADGLELRCLAHFLSYYDGGAYAKAVLYGSKEEKTSPHWLTVKALGKLCNSYDDAKTFLYALIYGAFDWKLGSILTGSNSSKNKKIGAEARRRVETGIKGLGKLRELLLEQLKERVEKFNRKWLVGIDGRRIYIRSDHAALNSLLQSAGGIIMKKALVILYKRLSEGNWKHGLDYWFVINSHDEWQIEVNGRSQMLPAIVGEMMVESMTQAGEYFNLKVPITGEYKIGKTWAETH